MARMRGYAHTDFPRRCGILLQHLRDARICRNYITHMICILEYVANILQNVVQYTCVIYLSIHFQFTVSICRECVATYFTKYISVYICNILEYTSVTFGFNNFIGPAPPKCL